MAGSASLEYQILTPRKGWAEQNPEIWLSSLYVCVRQMLNTTGISPSSIRAIGLAGQMHSLVCVNSAGLAARPAILWADQRSNQQARRLTDLIGRENLCPNYREPDRAWLHGGILGLVTGK